MTCWANSSASGSRAFERNKLIRNALMPCRRLIDLVYAAMPVLGI